MSRIARAALDVADERGAAGFSMRAVADRLGVTPMALYHHVSDKAGLIAVVVDEVIAERPLPAPTGAWREDLFDLAHWMRESTLAHPAIIRLRNDFQVWTPSIFPMTERWLSVWQQSGLELASAIRVAAVSSTAIIGFVEQELVAATTDLPDDTLLASFPNVRSAFSAENDPSADFELMVRSLVDGLLSSVVAAAKAGRPLRAPAGRQPVPPPRSAGAPARTRSRRQQRA